MTDIDPAKAHAMIGKTVLAGITYLDADGNALEHRQLAGEVLRINAEEGVVLASALDGQDVFLPPTLDHYTPAAPGDYTLRSMGLTISDPDYLCTWDVHLARGNDP
ncbi:hypothetical protein J7J08_09010 [Stenotrophomonas sp. ISL-67]|uniref:hypothetical protein n=1 Tax=Stenotrophomonas sp. ISL-67 TaxID=2819171 RepID=UPI001BE99060|nr:hypothetical protein [Stenotrophomonas sp. ISL-67]MBT2767778.1 hypothetical protein [Stenotrophomonas sp. ISL-67]